MPEPPSRGTLFEIVNSRFGGSALGEAMVPSPRVPTPGTSTGEMRLMDDLTKTPGGKFEVPTTLPPENLTAHPIADEWPMADPYEFEGLKDSIKKIGIQHPIVLYPDDGGKLKILDGRNRWQAAREVRYPFKPADFKIFLGTYEEAASYASAVNDNRRHMSKDQKEARVVRLLKKYPNMPSRKLAVMAGVSHTTIAKLRKPPADDGKLKALLRAWENAGIADQEEFVRAFKIDLTEMLRA
jgi:hypothetical protein